MSSVVRPMREDDVPDAAAIQSEAFGGNPADTIERYRAGPRYSWRDGWVVEDDGTIAAAAIAIPAHWWCGGARFAVSAIAGVAVRPTFRRRGLATQMMRAIVAADREAGRPLSLLYPFQHGYYRRLGYASVGFTHFFRLPLAQLPDAPALRRQVRELRPDDHEQVYELYRRSLAEGAGGLERNGAQWAKRWTGGSEQWVVFDDGTLHGYLAYERIEHEINVRELVAVTPDAERGLWAFLAAQIEQSTAVTYHAPTDRPLWALPREPLMHAGQRRGFVLTDAAHLTAGLMARLVDLPAALATRGTNMGVHGSIEIEIRDPLLHESLRHRLEIADGGISVAPGAGSADLACDIVTFGQLFCGVLRARDARWHGLLEATPAAAALLDAAFAGPTPFVHPADWF